jgi:Cdc6-like AAA superfamily ATPase
MTAAPAVETAWDWWERSSSSPKQQSHTHLTTGIAFLDAVAVGQRIEVSGASGTGKTTTLLTVAARAVVSSDAATQVLYFCPYRCDIVRLSTILQSLLWKEFETSSTEGNWEAKLFDGLRRIHICTAANDEGGWLPILETLPQQLYKKQSILWLWDDWDGLSPREVRQVERVLEASVPALFIATATQKTNHLSLPQQSIHLERVNEVEYRAALHNKDAPQHVPYSISRTAGILS